MQADQKYVVWTTWLLRLVGVSTCLAIVPVWIPFSWMAATHQWLGLGELPSAPIVDYMARSLSAMYFGHACMALAISTDVRRYRPLVGVLAAVNLTLAVILFVTDHWAGMPAYWTWLEGPPIAAASCLLGWLYLKLPHSD